jgi:hypothetical protein
MGIIDIVVGQKLQKTAWPPDKTKLGRYGTINRVKIEGKPMIQ